MRGVGDQGVVAWQPSRDGLTCAARRHCPSGPSPIAVVRAGCTRVAGRTREPDCAEGLRRLHPGVGTSDRRMPATIPTGATRCSSRSPSIPASAVSIHLGRTRSPPAGRGENRPPAAGRLATICADSRVRVHTNNAGPGIACAETLHAIVVGRAGVASGSWNSWSRESGGWSCHFFSLGGWWAGRRSPVRCCLWRGPLVGRSPTALEPGGAARRWCLRQPTSCRPGPRGVMRSALRVFGRGAGNYAGAFWPRGSCVEPEQRGWRVPVGSTARTTGGVTSKARRSHRGTVPAAPATLRGLLMVKRHTGSRPARRGPVSYVPVVLRCRYGSKGQVGRRRRRLIGVGRFSG